MLFIFERSDECYDNGYDLQSATSKASKLRTGTRFSTDS
jgi:hypothetical protein